MYTDKMELLTEAWLNPLSVPITWLSYSFSSCSFIAILVHSAECFVLLPGLNPQKCDGRLVIGSISSILPVRVLYSVFSTYTPQLSIKPTFVASHLITLPTAMPIAIITTIICLAYRWIPTMSLHVLSCVP